jgi:hypothetical protein
MSGASCLFRGGGFGPGGGFGLEIIRPFAQLIAYVVSRGNTGQRSESVG